MGSERGRLIKGVPLLQDAPLLSKQTLPCFEMLSVFETCSLAMKKADFTGRGGWCLQAAPLPQMVDWKVAGEMWSPCRHPSSRRDIGLGGCALAPNPPRDRQGQVGTAVMWSSSSLGWTCFLHSLAENRNSLCLGPPIRKTEGPPQPLQIWFPSPENEKRLLEECLVHGED